MAEAKQPVKAKELSKWGMAFGVALVVALSLARGFWPIILRVLSIDPSVAFGMSQMDILLLGGFCVIGWSPVYLSLWFDKFLKPKIEEAACGN